MDTNLTFDTNDFHYPKCQKCELGQFQSQYDWSFIPVGVCISLKDRDDRTNEATEQFHKVGLCRRVLFYRPEKDKSPIHRPATRGCWESHRKIAKTARDQWGLEQVLVFEDDVHFDDKITPERVQQFRQTLAHLPKNWNGCFLGHWPLLARPTGRAHTLRAVSLTTHAYVMNKPLMTWMINHPFDGTVFNKLGGLGIDCYLAVKAKMYAFYPMLAYQSGSVTSNPKPKFGGRILDMALADPKYMRSSQYLGLGTFYVLVLIIVLIVYFVGRRSKT